jgi:hypothetical protein
MIKKLIFLSIILFGIAGIARAADLWWSIYDFRWDDIGNGPYIVHVRQTRANGQVVVYQVNAGPNNHQKIDVEPKAEIEVEIWSDGIKLFEYPTHTIR